MKNLYRLVYTSARSKNCSEEDIQDILASCQENNHGLAITGVLVHTDRRFIQVVEGKKEEITNLYEKIKKDTRHGGVNLRYMEPIENRIFPDWHMAFKDASIDGVGFHTSISSDTKNLINSMLEGEMTSYDDRGMKVLKTFIASS